MPMRWAGYGFASDFRSLHARRTPPQRLQQIARGSNARVSDMQSGMRSAENNPMPLLQLSSLERSLLKEPKRTRPNLFYALTPCRLGTPYVLSFSSYVTR